MLRAMSPPAFAGLGLVMYMSEGEWSTVWDITPKTKIIVGENEVEVEHGKPFAETVIAIAREAGLKRFRVFVDGNEVSPNNAPQNFEGIQRVEIKPIDEAG